MSVITKLSVVKQETKQEVQAATAYFDTGDIYWYRGEGWYWCMHKPTGCWFGPYDTLHLAEAAKDQVLALKADASCVWHDKGFYQVVPWIGLCLVNILILPYILVLCVLSQMQRWLKPA